MLGLVTGSPNPDGVEVFQGKAEGVDFLVAIVAGLDRAVLGIELTNIELSAGVGLRDVDVRRRR